MLSKKTLTIANATLLILISLIIALTYIKFFAEPSISIQEVPINESSSNAIHKALQEIVDNFNQNLEVKEFCSKNNIVLTAVVNNYSIYVSYIDEKTITYEFNYENLCLNIVIDDSKENIEKFNSVFKFLIQSIQTRINNLESYNEIVTIFLNDENINYEGLYKTKIGNNIKYQVDITKKLSTAKNKNGGI